MTEDSCFVCGLPVPHLRGQDNFWDTYVLPTRREEDRWPSAQAPYGYCHSLCLTHSPWGRLYARGLLQGRREDPDDLSGGGWWTFRGGPWETAVVSQDGWLTSVPHRCVRLAEPHVGGMRLPILEPWSWDLNLTPGLEPLLRAGQGQAVPFWPILEALGVGPRLIAPQAFDRATLRPRPPAAPFRSENAAPPSVRGGLLSYDMWLPLEACDLLWAEVADSVPLDTDRLWQALEADDLEQVEALLQNGVSPDSVDEGGTTPLKSAAMGHSMDLARLLLSRGAQVNQLSEMGQDTALHVAAVHADLALVRLLLEHGADPNLMDEFEETPLSIAQKMVNYEEFRAVADALRRAGARLPPG